MANLVAPSQEIRDTIQVRLVTTPRTPCVCQTPGCDEPFGYVQGDALVIVSRHHGERHVNSVSLPHARLLQQARDRLVMLRDYLQGVPATFNDGLIAEIERALCLGAEDVKLNANRSAITVESSRS